MKALVLILMGLIILPTGCTTGKRGFPPTSTIDNFDKVSAKLYRGAQPNAVGLEYLATQCKVDLVVNLRLPGEVWLDEPLVCKRLGMNYTNVPLDPLSKPDPKAIEAIIKLIDTAPGPVFVHCQYGCDRTGTVIACYRIRHGMANTDALNDAEAHGISSWCQALVSYIKHFK